MRYELQEHASRLNTITYEVHTRVQAVTRFSLLLCEIHYEAPLRLKMYLYGDSAPRLRPNFFIFVPKTC